MTARRRFRLVVSSDWHGDATTAGFPRFEDVSAAVEETFDAATGMENKADLYVFLGDLADPDVPGAWAAAELACRMAARLAAVDVPSIWVAGNHDALEDGSGHGTLDPLRGWAHAYADLGRDARWSHERVRVCTRPETIRLLGFDVVALPYCAQSHEYDPQAFVRSLPEWVGAQGRRVLFLGHLNLDGIVEGSESFEMPRGRSTYWPTAEILARFGDRALMLGGHYHQRQVHRGVQIVGSLERLSFADGTSAPGYLVVEVEEG